MLKTVLSAAVVAALAILPLSVNAQEYSDPPKGGATTTTKGKKSGEAKTTTTETTTTTPPKTTKKREPTKGQLEARERQRKCGAEWREAKAKGTLEKGLSWPKFWSACNKRLKDTKPA
jgi:hypothetical protein